MTLVLNSIPTCSGMTLQCPSVEQVLDMSGRVCEPCHGNGGTKHRAAVCHLFLCYTLQSVTLPPQHMENFSRPLEMMQCQEHKPFAGTKCFLKAEPLLKMSSAATWTGGNTAQVRELFRSDGRLTVGMIADEVNMIRETIFLILTEELGMRKICAKMVFRNLTEQQQDAWLSAVFDIQMRYGDAAASLIT